jgi:energy-coupling factor transporter transmembrane protein EcfT
MASLSLFSKVPLRTFTGIFALVFAFMIFRILIKRVHVAKLGFEWRDTPIHRMHVIPRIAMFAALSSITSLWMDPRYLLIMLVVALTLFLLAKVPRFWLWMPVILLGSSWIGLITMVPFMTNQNLYKVLDPTWASVTFLDVGTFPAFGHIAYTRGSIIWWLGGILRRTDITLLTMALYYTTNIAEISHYLTKAKLPTMVTFSFFVTFRFIPVMMKLSSDITSSQKARGWEMKTRNPVIFIRKMYLLMYPIARQFMRTTDIVTLSVVNRAFGANPIRPHKHTPIKTINIVISVLLLASFFVAFYLTATPPFYGNL